MESKPKSSPAPLAPKEEEKSVVQPALTIFSELPTGGAKKARPAMKPGAFVLFDAKSEAWGRIKKVLEPIANSTTGTTAEQVLDAMAEIMLVTGKSKRHDTDQFPVLKKLLVKNTADHEDKECTGLFPFIAKQALMVEKFFPQGELPVLQAGQTCQILRRAVPSLVANCMLGTIPEQKSKDLPTPHNFLYFFQNDQTLFHEKLKFYLHYFREVQASEPKGSVSLSRRSLPKGLLQDPDSLFHASALLQEAVLDEKGKIEENEGMLQVDFANKFIGGGCMKGGAVQEEILFLICPELLVSRMVNAVMQDHDAIVVRGVQRFASYDGYAHGLRFAGNYHDKLVDGLKEDKDFIKREFLALDALHFRNPKDQIGQLRKNMVDREVRKAVAGFWAEAAAAKSSIATGRWGCGAFHGNAQLKFVIQWIAASICGRKMIFCSFGDKALQSAGELVKKYSKQQVGTVYKKTVDACKNYMKRNETKVVGAKKMAGDFDTFLFQSLLN